jgi:AraC family transcriptional regulator, regulatory protein of adaptative response / methylated-DNA-[protein]-cysteine methyltransferase
MPPMLKSRRIRDPSPDKNRYWHAVSVRDASLDGTFYYAVATTGIYCRPSCPARRPKRDNVRFYATAAAAEAAGYRPCKRCRPKQASLVEEHAARIARACRILEAADPAPSLAALAAEIGLSAYHFHRIFKATTGVTPKSYAKAQRRRRIQYALKGSRNVTEAIYDAGFSSSSRFYEASAKDLGMTPTQFKNGGDETTLRFASGRCSLGAILVAASDKGVAAILLGDNDNTLRAELRTRFPNAALIPADPSFEALLAQVIAAVEAPEGAFGLPLDVRGTAFQQKVWAALTEIPPGSTQSYAELARRIGQPTAARAVAGACAANPLAVVIPCHRVVRTDGSISGYRWGAARKRALLKRERSS